MRKFIISDLHGCGDIYESIITYLENLALVEEESVHLYINGDLIDRGLDSYNMLRDAIRRCHGRGNVVIHYLAGNHEELMYNACKFKLKHGLFGIDSWDLNGNFITKSELSKLSYEELEDLTNFIGNLSIYKKFPEKVDGKNILLVHAAAPSVVLDKCDLKLSSKIDMVNKALWSRIGEKGCKTVGKDGFITIVGHTMNGGKYGFMYDSKENVLNIDGCCGRYATGSFEFNRVPVVEVKNGKLEILVFSHDNEIVTAFTLDKSLRKMNDYELSKRRVFLNHYFDECGIEYRERIVSDKSNRLSDIDVKIYESPKNNSNADTENDSDMKIYKI